MEGARPRPLGLAVGEAERTRAFRRLSLAGVLPTDPVFLALGHIVPYAQDQGLFLHEASAGLTGIGVSSTAGRLVLSPLGDRFGSRASYGAAIAAMAILSFVWLGLPLRMAWSLPLGGVRLGVRPLRCPQTDPHGRLLRHPLVNGIIGLFYTAAGFGALLGPGIGGVLSDLTGSYRSAIFAATTFGAFAVAWVPPSWRSEATGSDGRRTEGSP